MQGVRFNITDALVHSTNACRRGGQIIPMTRRALMASVLTAKPVLMEPVYSVDIQVSFMLAENRIICFFIDKPKGPEVTLPINAVTHTVYIYTKRCINY